jgi:hypothetical protein
LTYEDERHGPALRLRAVSHVHFWAVSQLLDFEEVLVLFSGFLRPQAYFLTKLAEILHEVS